jgi:CRISPR-associated endonuclease/helicase Cas3
MSPDDFSHFYRAVHGRTPFPWQDRLAREVAEKGWPVVLAVPTAAGKTSTLDVAVFTLALQAGRPLAERSAPLRVFFVIDRRIVVDQAADHAHKLRQALESPTSPVVAEVARRLLGFGGPGPLHVAALRGGMYRNDTWARAPNQPTVCVSTVDQVGSRLLFRGYGLSHYRRPVHAGLTGHDALYLIDEAHLSEPFLETLAAVRRYRALAEAPVAGPFVVVEMSATPHSPGERFGLSAADRDNEVLRARLAAPKPAQLLPELTRFEAEAAARARSALDREGVRVVGVVVNRVASARQVFEELRGHKGADAVLLTGRVRPWDRQQLLRGLLGRVQADRKRSPEDLPLFVVATQTVEVGADLDFDALVTEAAPLAALRQRFGRLDRLGQFGRAAGVVLRRKARDADPIYGDELAETWDWLRERAGPGDDAVIDFGIDAFNALLARSPEPPRPPPRQAPVMLPAHLDSWAQTCPTPAPDPDVAPFLHGADALDAADVVIVWRADLAWDDGRDRPAVERDWVEAVAAARPLVMEGLPVPAGSARAWLKGLAAAEAADVEGLSPASDGSRGGRARPALCWRGPEDSQLVGPDDIRPGDTLVVPADYGGADRFGWAPGLRAAVPDIADACFNALADAAPDGGRARPIRLRLHPALYRQLLSSADDEEAAALARRVQDFGKHVASAEGAAEGEGDGREDLDWLLAGYRDAVGEDRLMAGAINLFQQQADRLTPLPYPGGIVLTLRVKPGFSGDPTELPPEAADADEPTGEDDTASLTRRPVSLEEHTAGVADRVRQFAAGCGLGERLSLVLERAARLHDLGKADPRFQAMLYGDEVAAAAGPLLAKSGLDPEDWRAFRESWRLSGLPAGFRHEFVSVAIVRRHRDELLEGLSAEERELAEYLVGTHHGRGRAFAPWVPEKDPEIVALDWEGVSLSASPDHGLWRVGSGWTELFWRLVRRHGYWGLAYLEAVLVLADQARSRDEEAKGTT